MIGHETVGIEGTGLTYDVDLVIIFMLEVFEELEESLEFIPSLSRESVFLREPQDRRW